MSKSNAKGGPAAVRKVIPLDDLMVPTVPDMQSQWSATCVGEELCRHIVDDVVRGTYPYIMSCYLDELAVPFTTQAVLSDLIEAMSFAFLEREPAMGGLHRTSDVLQFPPLSTHSATSPTTAGAGGSKSDDDGTSSNASSVPDGASPTLTGPFNQRSKMSVTAAPPPVVVVTQAMPPPGLVVVAADEETDEEDAARDDGTLDIFVPKKKRRSSSGGNGVGQLRRSEAGWEPAKLVEPSTVPADSWCRATIQQRRRIGETARQSDVASDDVSSRAGASGGTFRRTLGIPGAGRDNGGNSRKASSNDLNAVAAGGRSTATTPNGMRARAATAGSGSAQTSERPSRQSSAGTQRNAAKAPASRGSSPDPSEGQQDEARLLASVAENANRMKSLKAMSEAVHKQLAALKSNTAGFVVDGATHTVVEIVQLDAKNLPAQRAEPRVAMPDETPRADPTPDPNSANNGRSSAQRAFTPAGMNKPKTKRREENVANFWQPEPNTNPMIAEVQPAAGVTHRDGDSVRHTDLKPQKSRLSRAEYAKLVTLQAVAAQTVPNSLDGDPSSAPPPAAAATVAPGAASSATAPGAPTPGGSGTTDSAPGAAQVAVSAATTTKRAGATAGKASSAPNTRVSTPLLIQRPGSENSGAAQGGVLRHPGGGIAPVARTPVSRVSTPGPLVNRPVVMQRPPSVQSVVRPPAARPKSGAAAFDKSSPLRLRNVEETDDEVARDFLLSYTPALVE